LAVKVRLTRVGSKKNPIWRVVVADGRAPRDGRSIETIGHYNPQTQPSRIEIDRERLQYWLDRGAQPSNTVKKLIRAENTGYDMPARDTPTPSPTPAPREAAAEETIVPDAEAADIPVPEADANPPADEAPAGNEAGEGGPGEEPPVEAPEVTQDESEAPADADENP
jgi:small subunit ribosomal protein S16